MPRSIFAYHSVSFIPVLTMAAIYGIERISRWNKKFSAKELAGFVVILSLIGGSCLSPLQLPGARNYWAPSNLLNWPDPNLPEIRSAVVHSSSVSAQANIGAHFSQRKEIYQYPKKVGEADTIVLRLKSPTKNIDNFSNHSISDRKYMVGSLDAHLQMDRVEYISSINQLLSKKEYGVLLWRDPWLVFSKDTTNRKAHKQIKQKLNQLRKEWKIE